MALLIVLAMFAIGMVYLAMGMAVGHKQSDLDSHDPWFWPQT